MGNGYFRGVLTTSTPFPFEPCSQFWDETQATFTKCALKHLSILSLVLASVFCVLVVLEPLPSHKLRPAWLKPFPPNLAQGTSGHKTAWQSSCTRLLTALTFLNMLVMAILGTMVQEDIRTAWLLCASWAVILVLLSNKQSVTSPVGFLLFYLVTSVLHIGLRNVSNLGANRVAHELAAGLCAISAMITLSMPFRQYIIGRRESVKSTIISASDTPSPEDDVALGSFLSVSWLTPLTETGKKGKLRPAQVWRLPEEIKSRALHEAFRALRGTLIHRLSVANGIDLLILGIIAFGDLICESMLPLILSQLLRSMQDFSITKPAVMTYAVIALFVRCTQNQLSVLNTWYGRRSYERCRSEITMMIFEKALWRKTVVVNASTKKQTNSSLERATKSSNSDSGNASVTKISLRGLVSRVRQLMLTSQGKHQITASASIGTILNLVRSDTSAVAQRFLDFGDLIKAPIGLISTAALVWNVLGPSCYLGILAMIIGQFANGLLSKNLIHYGRIRKKATDERLRLTSQFIEALRHLRWYEWQDHWLERLFTARDLELVARLKFSVLQVSTRLVNVLAGQMFPVLALYAYAVLAHQPLRVELVFPALQLFKILDSKLRQIPDLITTIIDASTSIARVESFMAEPELDSTAQGDACAENLELKNCSFAWPGTDLPVLRDLNLSLDRGLAIISGEVGSGKTALLLSLLGEMNRTSGTYKISQQRIAYCSQTPWLQSMSIRENILFFRPFDGPFYHKILNACQLSHDVSKFADGDESLIGENGIGLSGGQKARVALARAIYSRPEILLLDNPLAALDHDVAESIARKLFGSDLLQDCTTILVTHRVDLVRQYAKTTLRVRDYKLEQITPHAAFTKDADNDVDPSSAEQIPEQQSKPVAKKFVEDERRTPHGSQFRVYWLWITAGGLHWWALEAIAVVSSQLFDVLYSWYIKVWGEAYVQTGLNNTPWVDPLQNSTTNTGQSPNPAAWLLTFPPPEQNPTPWLLGFVVISILPPLATLGYMIFELVISTRASNRLFKAVLKRVSTATFRYYDVTPTGRLMNRLTSDMSVVDGQVSGQFIRLAIFLSSFASSLAVISFTAPAFLVGTIGIVTTFVYVYQLYLPTSKSLRRLEGISLSPLFSSFGELLHGSVTIRVFRVQQNFLDRAIAILDQAQAMDHYYWAFQAWLVFRLDNISALAVFLLTTLAVYTKLTAGMTALVLISGQDFIQATHALCRQYGRLQMHFISVERVEELLHVDQEPLGTIKPPAAWPTSHGDIVFDNVTIRYAPHMPPALHNVNVVIPGGSKIAITGRTGSGKTTFVQALLAIVRAETGRVLIDGHDVNHVSVAALRSRVIYVAQDAVLFAGTIRDNLDPRHEFDDDECASVLARVAPRAPFHLETKIESGGSNISQGERQLIGIARAVLRKSAVLIMDEATASIDVDAAEEIYRVLEEELEGKHCDYYRASCRGRERS